MMLHRLARLPRAAFVAGAVLMLPAAAIAQQPSAGAIATATEIVDVRGAMAMFEPLIPGVIEQAKNVLLQTNPTLGKDLNEVAANLRQELAARSSEIKMEAAKIYTLRFTEQELKDMLAFYKSPLGKKMLTEEPHVVEMTLRSAQEWANRFSEEVINKFRAEMKKRGHSL
jgi:hypothetical protein